MAPADELMADLSEPSLHVDGGAISVKANVLAETASKLLIYNTNEVTQ